MVAAAVAFGALLGVAALVTGLLTGVGVAVLGVERALGRRADRRAANALERIAGDGDLPPRPAASADLDLASQGQIAFIR
jgi:hypothetical protein